MRWSLVVVRRLKTRIGDRVDIGVEYVGQNPRGVTMALDSRDRRRDRGDRDKKKSGVFTALYLRESAKQPVMPFKTLIMSTAVSTGTRCLTLRSATAEYTVRLKEPIEEQDDFVWLPYEVLERRARRPCRRPQTTADAATRSTFPRRSSRYRGDTPTDWLVPQFGRRAESAA